MAKEIEPMTSGPIWKRITFFALPLLLGHLFQQLYTTVDALIVGNFLGPNALAAVSSSGSLIFMMIGFFGGISNGAGVVISNYFGAKQANKIHQAVHTAVAFGLLAGLVLTILGVSLSPQILEWMGTPDVVMAESVTYLRIYFAGSLAFVIYNVLVGILQAVGDSRHPLYYLIVSSIVNLVLDILFIAYFKMGVEGAAFATIISQLISATLSLIHLLKSREVYRLQLSHVRIHRGILQQIVRIGLPSGVQNSIIAFANLIVQSKINSFGEMAMAGYGAYSKIEGFVFLPIMAFNMALTTFVGQNLGAKEYQRTKQGARFGVILAVILATLVGIPVFVFAPQLIAAFDSTPAVIQFGIEKSRTAAPFYFLLAYTHASSAVLRGAGKAMIPMLVMMACWCFARIGFLMIMVPLTQSIQTVYWVYPLTWGLSSIALFAYYKRVDWMGLSKLD